MSILLHHFKELTQCISEVERIEAKVEGPKQYQDKEEEGKEIPATTLDSYFTSKYIES
jgi:hypothetical protein